MDPFSIIGSAVAATKAIYQVSTTLTSFVQGALHVDKSLKALIEEVSSLQTAISCVKSGLASPLLRDKNIPDSIDVADDVELFASIKGCLNNCAEQLEEFESTLVKIKGGSGRNNLFKNPVQQIKLDLNAKEIVLYRAQIATHTSALQLMLQMLNVHICTRIPDVVMHVLCAKIEVLEKMMAKFDPCKNTQPAIIVQGVPDYNAVEFTSSLKRAAVGVALRASRVVSSASTMSGGSVASDPRFVEKQQATISAWDSSVSPKAEEELGALTGSFNRLSEQNFDTEAFSLLTREGQLLFEKEKLTEAEKMYRRALQLGKISNLDRNATNLKLAFLYKKWKKWDAAKQTLTSVVEMLNKDVSSLPSSQVWLTYHTLAGVYLKLNDLVAAELYCKRAMNAARTEYGREHPEYLRCIRLLVVVCVSKGDIELAAAFDKTLPEHGHYERLQANGFGEEQHKNKK